MVIKRKVSFQLLILFIHYIFFILEILQLLSHRVNTISLVDQKSLSKSNRLFPRNIDRNLIFVWSYNTLEASQAYYAIISFYFCQIDPDKRLQAVQP